MVLDGTGEYWKHIVKHEFANFTIGTFPYAQLEVHKVRYLGADLHLAFAGCRRFTGLQGLMIETEKTAGH